MNWKDISVFKWQQLINLFTKEKELDEIDLALKSLAIVKGMTENEVNSLLLADLKKQLKDIEFIHEEIEPKAQKFIEVNGRRYKCVYDVRKMPMARYIESKYFATDVNNNLHKICASMVLPMKKTLFGWKVDKYDASKHDEYAQDMLEAPITAILGSVVFFYQIYQEWIKISKDYLIAEMMEKNLTREESEAVHQTLCEIMDGFTKPNWLQIMNESRYKMLMS